MRRFLHDQRGQAIAEYSTLTFGLLIGSGALAFALPFGPHNTSLVTQLYAALQVYVDSLSYCLALAAT